MPRRRSFVGAAILVVTVFCVMVWVRWGLVTDAAEAQLNPSDMPLGVGALGRVEPGSRIRKLSHPGAFAVAQIAELRVSEGDRVVAGDVVAVFADADYKQAAVQQAEAAVALSRAALAKVRAASRAEEIDAQRARILALRAAEASVRRDAERAEVLVPYGAGGAATAERARYAATRATAERAEAEATLELMLRPRAEDVAVAQAELIAAEAALRRATAEAALTRVVAPVSGTVLKIYARPGELVGAEGLLDLGDLSTLDVLADVYETDLPRLRLGAMAEVIVPGEARRYHAEVREIGRLVRRTTRVSTDPVAMLDARTFEVRLRLSEEGRQALEYRINLQVQVSIAP